MSGGGQQHGVAGGADQAAAFQAGLVRRIAALTGLAGLGRQFDRGQQADVADIHHVGQALEAVGCVFPIASEFAAALEQAFAMADVERGQGGRARHRMARVGVAMGQFDGVVWALHEGVVDVLAHQRGAHRDGAVGQALGAGDEVRRDAEMGRGEGAVDAAEGADDFVEDQQDAVPVADLAQLLQVAARRHQHAGGTRHRFDDDGGDGRGVMQRDDAFERIGQVRAPVRLAAAVGHLFAVIGMRQVVDIGQQVAEGLAMPADARHRQAAEAHPVIRTFAADQAHALAFAARAVIAQRDLEGGVDGFGTGVRKEHLRVAGRRLLAQPFGQLERLWMAHLERRRIVQVVGGARDGLDDLRAPMASVDAPQAGDAVQHAAAVGADVVHALGRAEQHRIALVAPVGGEGHPIGVGIEGRRRKRRGRGHGLPASREFRCVYFVLIKRKIQFVACEAESGATVVTGFPAEGRPLANA